MKKAFCGLLISLMAFMSCNKNKLNLKPNQALLLPKTVADFKTLLYNINMNISSPSLGEISADNYYMPLTAWTGSSFIPKYCYIWAKDPFQGNSPTDWFNSYRVINYANLVLSGVNTAVGEVNTPAYNDVKGCALFYRAFALWQLAQVFCKPYNAATANSDLGIPIRLGTDPLVLASRATVQQTYNQIIEDLLSAKDLIDTAQHYIYPTNPARPAVLAMLGRVYLSMRAYKEALQFTNSALGSYNMLLTYSSLSESAPYSFEQYNKEVIFAADMVGSSTFNSQNLSPVDTVLYKAYDANDLRRTLFYTKTSNGLLVFKGTYSGGPFTNFCGIATDELYLNRAECYARTGDITSAMKDLNILMINRWRNNGTFVPFTATDSQDALNKILIERRKELVYRGLRWTDLRRLNLEGANIQLSRTVDGVTYTLKPNSPNYVLPIPKSETDYNPLPQNERE